MTPETSDPIRRLLAGRPRPQLPEDFAASAQKGAILQKIPAGDLGAGEDIGAAVVYLASREAGYVTGQTLHVNGGMAMI